MRIAIADDHTLVCQSLRAFLLSIHPDWEVVEASSLAGALEAVDERNVDLLLIDLGMPGMNGAASVKDIRAAHPTLRVAVLTGNSGRDTILECLSAGVHGYILKADTSTELLSAVRRILAGEIYVPSLLAQNAQPSPAPIRLPFSGIRKAVQPTSPRDVVPDLRDFQSGNAIALTPRQHDVLGLLAEGQSTKTIARTLDLGVGTVKVHLAGIYRAIGAQNRMDAVVKAQRLVKHD